MAQYQRKDLHSWEEFVAEVAQLREETKTLRTNAKGLYIPEVLFRGQRSADWNLETTLERYRPLSLSLMHYYTSIWAARTQIEAHTQQRWEIDIPRVYLEKARNSDSGFELKTSPPAYDYLTYLRHHGFPSPLLDWSRSPYVAAFFAFRHRDNPTARVAIYAYREQSKGVKVGTPTAPQISTYGPYVRTHRRHFLQQCHYTVCMVYRNPEWLYTSHEDVFGSKAVGEDDQDQLWKFTLPRTERQQVLAYLDEHNLNAYSLFGSEEALMETMAGKQLL
jgi:hypothetical protein